MFGYSTLLPPPESKGLKLKSDSQTQTRNDGAHNLWNTMVTKKPTCRIFAATTANIDKCCEINAVSKLEVCGQVIELVLLVPAILVRRGAASDSLQKLVTIRLMQLKMSA